MSPAFLNALAKVLGHEGGYVHNPRDRGGATNRGITQRTYDSWRKTTGQATRSVEFISDVEMKAIYFDNYWLPCSCEALPEHLAYPVFDMAVNSGVWNAKVTLQESIGGITVDGIIGPQTIEAAKQRGNLLSFLKKRGAFIRDILIEHPDQVVFVSGWFNRLLDQAWR